MNQEAFIYVIGVDQQPVKIGRAENPYKRIASLQVGSPGRLTLHDALMVHAPIADKIEREVHHHFRSLRLSGEWFDVGHEAASEVVERYASHLSGQYRQANPKADTSDVLRLMADGRISHFAGRAIAELRRYPNRTSPWRVHLDAAIKRAGGQPSAAIFDAVVVRGNTLSSLFGVAPTKRGKAEDALVVALSAMVEHDAHTRAEAIRSEPTEAA